MTDFGEGKIAYEGQTYDADTNTVSGTVTGGNPISYYNGTRWEMEWEQGRQLGAAQNSTDTEDTTLGYNYDADGIRTSKTYTVNTYAEAPNVQHTVTFKADNNTVAVITVNDGYVLQDSDYPTVPPKTLYIGSWDKYTAPIHEDITITAVYTTYIPNPKPIVPEIPVEPASVEATAAPDRDGQLLVSTQTVQHDYITQNGKVVRETITTDDTVTAVMDFIYDESGKPFALIYSNGTATPDTYYYVLNLQGDVVGLVNSSGGWVAQYTYNAWGEIITSSGSMADINPLRYRGYYYDTETGFYYLQSRYYDPVTHRFINADSYASTGQGILGHNMFTYCLNNPAIFRDPEGTDAVVLLDSTGVGHIGIMVQDENGIWWHFYWGTSGGWNIARCIVGLSVPSDSWCEEYTGETVTLDQINAAGQYNGSYEEMCYLTGDFSACVNELKGQDGKYRLYRRNCSQISLEVLSSAQTDYSDMLQYASKNYTRPTKAFAYVENRQFIIDYLNRLFLQKE